MQETSIVAEILAGASISTGILNQFVGLFYKMQPNDVLLKPDRTMRRYLHDAKHIFGSYYLSYRYIFEIENGNIKNILMAPALSDHAKQRLLERFGVNKEECIVRASLAITNGSMLSQQEKHRLRIRRNAIAIQFEDTIYLLSEKYRVITVILANYPSPSF